MTKTMPDLDPLGKKSNGESFMTRWFFPLAMLLAAYALLFLTFTSQIAHAEAMRHCVLMDEKLSRIWSVGNIEIGVAYLGVFTGMLFYFLRLYRKSGTHLRDLLYAVLYLICSFILDLTCIKLFEPFVAMLIGDAIVMTFTVIVSRQLWFQRLLGVFVPIIFLTCGIGHFLEGMSYWRMTYPVNVPWTMVTADIGFAVLVNSSRFPAFIRGEDIVTELSQQREQNELLLIEVEARTAAEAENLRLLNQIKTASDQQRKFLRDVLASVTEGRLRLCFDVSELPDPLATVTKFLHLTSEQLRVVRQEVRTLADASGFAPDQQYDFITAVSEAAMNAVVHAGGGSATVSWTGASDTPKIQVRIEDSGTGIAVDRLPAATLERGYSSAGTLGQGFWLILKTAESVWLYTSPQGTTIVLEHSRVNADAVAMYRIPNGLNV